MTKNKQVSIVWLIRILVAVLFIFSAYAKIHPEPSLKMAITNFELKYLGGVGIEGAFAKILSRALIALEFALGMLILLPYYTKKIIVPATIALLVAFCIHLMLQVTGGVSSNCGCFGELIPMTPLQALIKNLITIVLLILPFTVFKEGIEEKKNFYPIIGVYAVILIVMFAIVPPSFEQPTKPKVENQNTECNSEYCDYFDDISNGDKILCFFSPTCEHCQATGKKLIELKNTYPELMPEVKVLFMDEADNGSAAEIKEFFKIAGGEFDYKVLTIEEFLPIFWQDKNFPGVLYLHNGEPQIFYDGTEDNEFNSEELIKQLKKDK